MKICVVASAGGHLQQCLKLKPILEKYEFFIITLTASHLKSSLKDYRTYFVENPKRNPLRYLTTFPTFLNIIRKERPDVVITTGAGVAVPACLIAKYLFGAKIIFIESFSRIFEPSQTGQLLYRFADLFIVQWDTVLGKYGKKAVYGGTLL